VSRLLVLTTVHQADDPRIRERTIGSLAKDFEVTYAAKPPAPTNTDGIEWVPLNGGRVRRWWKGLRLLMSKRYAVRSIHDPELIPAALLGRMLGRRTVFDLHEDVPAQIRHKGWVWRPLRIPLAWLSHLLLRMASRFLVVTMAEPGYGSLFMRGHAVFPNHAPAGALPDLADDGGYLIYVGDVTVERGALDLVESAALADPRRPLVVVGRCPLELAGRMRLAAEAAGVDLSLTGNLAHGEAMRRAAGATVGLSLLRDLPNEAGSMPTKVIEYLQMGIPVVATDLPGTSAAVTGLEAVRLVPPGDAVAAARAVGEALGERETARAQAVRLREELVWPDEQVRELYAASAG
jgi:glycosyltransferase involved in cell wall biosynthesis